ncbi:unnamed protein product, partial [marine sediment metagenome]
ETDRNIQEGTGNILRGLYQLIRNPRHHNKIKDEENDAIEIIMFIQYMISVIDKSKLKFEIEDFKGIVFDKEFVEDEKYSDIVVERIPKRRIYDVAVEIYHSKDKGNIYNIQRFFNSISQRMSDGEIKDFLQIISSDLLKTNSDKERKYALRCFPVERWKEIDEIARLRTENRIIKSIKEGKTYAEKDSVDGWFATWCTSLISEFSLKKELINAVSDKLNSDDFAEVSYCIKFILDEIWKILEDEKIASFLNEDNGFTNYLHEYSHLITIKDEIKR